MKKICESTNKQENTIVYDMKKSERENIQVLQNYGQPNQICLTFYQRYIKHARMPAWILSSMNLFKLQQTLQRNTKRT